MVNWPSRDVDGIATLLRRGFAPRGVVAARHRRPPSRRPRSVPARRGGCARASVIRRAGPADIDTVVRAGGGDDPVRRAFRRRDRAAGHARCACGARRPGMLAGPEPWIWLAEREATPIGMLYAERPEAAGWIAPMVRLAPVAYLTLMFVLPGERGDGVGAALAAQLHGRSPRLGCLSRCCTTSRPTRCPHRSGGSRDTGRCGPPGRPVRPAPSDDGARHQPRCTPPPASTGRRRFPVPWISCPGCRSPAGSGRTATAG